MTKAERELIYNMCSQLQKTFDKPVNKKDSKKNKTKKVS